MHSMNSWSKTAVALKSGAGFPTVGAAFSAKAEGDRVEEGRHKRTGLLRFLKGVLGERRVDEKRAEEVEAISKK